MTVRAFAVLVVVLAIALPTRAGPPLLSLPAVIDRALANNPGLMVERLEVDRADAEQQAARGGRWPNLDLTAGATQYGYPTFVHGIRELGVFPPLDDTINELGISLRLPIYTGGKLTTSIAIAELGTGIARERERLGRQELVFNVSSVYFKIQQLESLKAAYQARIASLQSQERRVQLLRDAGRAAKLDQLRITGQLTKARYDLLQIENRAREARTVLHQLMGEKSPQQAVSLTRYAVLAPAGELSRDVATLALRPDLRIAEGQLVAGVGREKLARDGRYPALSLVSGYRERSGDAWQFYEDWNVGLQVTLPLFDGGVRRVRIDQATLARRQAEQAIAQTRLEADRQSENAWHARAEAAARLSVTDTSVAEAGEGLVIEQLKLEQGGGVGTDVLSAETAVLTAQADRLQAEFDLIVTGIDLLRANGSLDVAGVQRLIATDTP